MKEKKALYHMQGPETWYPSFCPLHLAPDRAQELRILKGRPLGLWEHEELRHYPAKGCSSGPKPALLATPAMHTHGGRRSQEHTHPGTRADMHPHTGQMSPCSLPTWQGHGFPHGITGQMLLPLCPGFHPWPHIAPFSLPATGSPRPGALHLFCKYKDSGFQPFL